jgi:sulfite exporter TauE/SafE
MTHKTPKTDVQRAVAMLIIIAAVYLVLQQFGVLNFLIPTNLAFVDMGYGLLFVIGLLTSVHCIAMCGGINMSQSLPACLTKGRCCVYDEAADTAADGGEDLGINACSAGDQGHAAAGNAADTETADTGAAGKTGGRCSVIGPSILYNAGRVASYTIIGVGAGALGSVITFSVTALTILKLVAGAVMVVVGIGMLGIFPRTRRIVPKITAAGYSKIYKGKGPLVVGLLNGFMPCGPIVVVQIYALSTGSPLKGAISMLLFSLGTVPLVFGLGTFSSFIGKKSAQKVAAAGAVMIAALGLCMLTQSWNLFGLTRPSFAAARHSGAPPVDIAIDRGPQIINSTLSPYSYSSIKVEVDRPVRWIIDAPPGSINSCNYKIIIRKYGISYVLKPGENVVEFIPRKRGRVRFSCWMGIISGTITVVGPGEAAGGLLEKRQRPPREGEPCC